MNLGITEFGDKSQGSPAMHHPPSVQMLAILSKVVYPIRGSPIVEIIHYYLLEATMQRQYPKSRDGDRCRAMLHSGNPKWKLKQLSRYQYLGSKEIAECRSLLGYAQVCSIL